MQRHELKSLNAAKQKREQEQIAKAINKTHLLSFLAYMAKFIVLYSRRMSFFSIT
jgi:hypothetical protein